MEAIELPRIGNELRPLRLEHLPHRLLGELWVAMRLGVRNAFIEQPCVQLIVVLEPQPRREEALTDEPDLVLDLSLLPARRRSAGQTNMRKVDGWQTLATKPIDQPIDLAA